MIPRSPSRFGEHRRVMESICYLVHEIGSALLLLESDIMESAAYTSVGR